MKQAGGLRQSFMRSWGELVADRFQSQRLSLLHIVDQPVHIQRDDHPLLAAGHAAKGAESGILPDHLLRLAGRQRRAGARNIAGLEQGLRALQPGLGLVNADHEFLQPLEVLHAVTLFRRQS